MLAIWLVAIFLLGLSETDADFTIDQPAIDRDAPSASRLAQTLTRQHDALTAVSLVYTSLPGSRSRKGEPEGAYWRRAISVSRAGLFRSDNSHGHDRLPWSLDPKRKTLVITPMESTLLENLNRSVADFAYEGTGEAPAVLRNQENIFDVLCWWPFVDWPAPQLYGHVYSMRELLNEGSYRLLPEKVVIASRLCHTFVVNDILTVWCDCDRPECVLKSERYDPKSRAIESRFELMEYEEVRDGIWLPKQFRIVRCDSHAHTQQLRERVVYDSTFLVSDIKVNEDVDVSIFRQEYAPGTVRAIGSLEDTRYVPVVDGQLDHFKSIVEWCRSLQTTAKQSGRWGDRMLIFVLLCLVLAAVHIALRRHAGRGEQPRG